MDTKPGGQHLDWPDLHLPEESSVKGTGPTEILISWFLKGFPD